MAVSVSSRGITGAVNDLKHDSGFLLFLDHRIFLCTLIGTFCVKFFSLEIKTM